MKHSIVFLVRQVAADHLVCQILDRLMHLFADAARALHQCVVNEQMPLVPRSSIYSDPRRAISDLCPYAHPLMLQDSSPDPAPDQIVALLGNRQALLLQATKSPAWSEKTGVGHGGSHSDTTTHPAGALELPGDRRYRFNATPTTNSRRQRRLRRERTGTDPPRRIKPVHIPG